jgi:hypothetical protein
LQDPLSMHLTFLSKKSVSCVAQRRSNQDKFASVYIICKNRRKDGGKKRKAEFCEKGWCPVWHSSGQTKTNLQAFIDSGLTLKKWT